MLTEVTLADRDVVNFAVCELKGIELRNCPACLQGWIAPNSIFQTTQRRNLVWDSGSRRTERGQEKSMSHLDVLGPAVSNLLARKGRCRRPLMRFVER